MNITITGKRLRQLREERQMSQEDVARLLKINRTTYLKYENGDSRPVRKLKELADLFGVSSDYIMGFSDSPKQEKGRVLSLQESKLLERFHLLDHDDQVRITERIETLLEADKYKEKAAHISA